MAALLLGLTNPPALAQRRVALLVGNNAYQNVPVLNTAINDAHALAETLGKLNFSVIVAENQSSRAMSEALLALDRMVEPGDTALFFFAGHGFEIRGENFLVPTDIPVVGEGQEELVRDAAYPATRIVERLQARGARTVILVLDACRNNPFERSGGRGLKGAGGLAPMTPAEGVFILMSAGAKQVALDRLSGKDGDPNSVFSRNFIRELQEPGLTLVQIAKRTQMDVRTMASTIGREQTPAYYDQIVGDVVLNGAAGAALAAAVPTPQVAALPSAIAKQPQALAVRPPPSEALAELEALAADESWHELGTRLTEVKPTERSDRWKALVEQAALGELAPLTSASSGSPDERLAAIEHYYPAFASLRGSQRFMALRARIGLDAFGRCFDRSDGEELQRCRDRLDRFVHTAPMSAELARDAGTLVVHKLNHANAAPFFAMAFEAPHGDLVCAAPELETAVISALGSPGEWLEAKSAVTLADQCWPNLQRAIVAEVARETPDSYYVHNSCPLLAKHNAMTGSAAARCRATAK
ncbi:caspase family protein [Bradyrhizobium sp.]|uniref:caspase family protein n=1 Tax=Bradyrhizobium sp. TaxID=376 RepID=UPI0025BC87D6|nr:caspase family protein [Bradyrhizobium sp.]